MRLRGLVIAVFVLCGLAGALYWSGRHKPSEESSEPAGLKSPLILKVDEATVTGLAIKSKGTPAITLAKSDDGKWKITGPGPYNADKDAVSEMLSTLSPLNAERVIENGGGNLERYGLYQPSLEVDITGKDGKTQQVDFGDPTPTGDAVYAMVVGNPKVFTTPSFSKSGLNKSLNDLRDKRLLPVNVDKITRMEFLRGHQDIVFGHSKDSWRIEKPKPLRTDDSAVDDLAQQLVGARMDLSGLESGDAGKTFARAQPVATAKITDDAGSQTLQVRKSGNNYYAKSSVVKGAYQVDSSLGEALDKNLDDFRNKTLFDFSYRQPDKIELHDGYKAWFLTRSGDNWWSNGKKMDEESVDSLVSQLRGLTASKFVDSGFSKPDISATVTSWNGKEVEEAQIAKAGKDYIAKRRNEPSLYALNASDVDELLQAAAGIKPEAVKK